MISEPVQLLHWIPSGARCRVAASTLAQEVTMMPTPLKQRLFKAISERTLRHLRDTGGSAPTDLGRRVYAQARQDFLLAGPITLHAANPRLMAGMWIGGRETILVEHALDRVHKEALATAVARSNECPYCVDMHGTMTHGGKRTEVAGALVEDDVDALEAGPWRTWVEWGLGTGRPPGPAASRPFSGEQAPEAIGTAVFFHYINRMVNVFFTGTPLDLPRMVAGFKPLLLRIFGWELRREMRVRAEPGTSLGLLPEGDLPDDLSWTKPHPVLPAAWSRWARIVEEEGRRILSPEARAVITRHLEAWRGEDPGLSRTWTVEVLEGLPDADMSAARLALLTARASYQVSDADVEAFRAVHPGDRELLGATAWGAFVAARRVGTWLAGGGRGTGRDGLTSDGMEEQVFPGSSNRPTS